MKIEIVYLLFCVCSIGLCLNSDILYTIELEYACMPSLNVKSCEANIIWNNHIVASLNPSDSAKKTLSISVKVDAYRLNVLQIEATGLPDGKGLTMDNIKLFKNDDPTKRNVIVNGGFEEPVLTMNQQTLTEIKGWYVKEIRIGKGTFYNPVWASQVLNVETTTNNIYSQAFTYISNGLVPMDKKVLIYPEIFTYKLEFDWAIRPLGTDLDTYQLAIVVNNRMVGSINPTTSSLAITHHTVSIQLAQGLNYIAIDGSGPTDNLGIVVKNFKLTSDTNTTNLLINSNFEQPALSSGEWKLYNRGIKGWYAEKVQIGSCSLYGNNWSGGQCVETASDKNQRLIQKFLVYPPRDQPA